MLVSLSQKWNFPTARRCRKFKPPSWFGREVTGEKRYSNVRLANE